MKVVLQRVNSASCEVDGKIVGSIGKGYLLLVGVGKESTHEDADRIAKKVVGARIFADENDKINLNLSQVGGNMLIISQFTLYADVKKGNRPSFVNAAEPLRAEEIYNYFAEKCRELSGCDIQKGIFGADMKINLVNNGPFTLIYE